MRGERGTVAAAAILFAALTVQYLVAATTLAATAPWWMDEVLALWTARQPDVPAIWHALVAGAEFTPPAYDLALHGWMALGAASPLALRLPGILAVYAAALLVGRIAWRHAGMLPAMVAAGAMLSSGLLAFAVQARPYAFVTLVFAGALAVYDRAPSRRRAVLTGALLALAIALHFYALLLAMILALVELVRAHSERRAPHYPTLVAIAVAAASLLLWWPILAAARTLSGQDVGAPAYYARPTLDALVDSYAAALGWLTVPLALLVTVRRDPVAPALRDIGLVLLAIPLLVFAFAALVSHSYADRYVIAAAAGAALLLAALIQRMPRWTAPALLALFLLGNMWRPTGELGHRDRPAALATVAAAPGTLPIATGSGLRWFEIAANAPPAIRRRLVYVDIGPSASPDPTNHHQAMRWKAIDPRLHVIDTRRLLCTTPAFWLFVDPWGGPDPLPEWLRGRAAFTLPARDRPALVLVRPYSHCAMQRVAL